MPNDGGMFRRQSLEHRSAPADDGAPLRVVDTRAWLWLATIATGLVLLLAWGVFGRVLITVRGSAVLVRPKQLVAFQAPADGRVEALLADAGQRVERGDVLARLALPNLERELEEERLRLERLRERSTARLSAERGLAEEERAFLEEKRALLSERRTALLDGAADLRARRSAYLAEQRRNVDTAASLSRDLGEDLRERRDAFEAQGSAANLTELIGARSEVIDNELRQAELEVKARELDVTENLDEEAHRATLDLVRDLESQITDLDLRATAVKRRLLERELAEGEAIDDVERRVTLLETRLAEGARVIAQASGRLIEITATPGQRVTLGQRLGKVELDGPDQELQAVAYFAVADGKKVRPGLPLRITPSTVEYERDGSIRGSALTVSDYAVTTDAAANQIGDVELARTLLGGENRIEVIATLETNPDTFSGYAWTSGAGPDDITVTAGTTAEVRVTIEERAPIELVLPFLRSMVGE